MSRVHPILSRSGLVATFAITISLAACGSKPPLKDETPTVEQRLLELERRMDRLEAGPAVQTPYRNKAEIQAHIKSLEGERNTLLTRYLPEHPAIRDIDRRLEILNRQLKLLQGES